MKLKNLNLHTLSLIKCFLYVITLVLLLASKTSAAATEKLTLSASFGSPLILPITEILQQAYQSIGVEIEIKPYPELRSLRYANYGVTDGVAFGEKSIENIYKDLIRIDIVLREGLIYLFTKQENSFTVNGWQSIPKDYAVGHIRGIKFIEKAMKQFNFHAEPSDNTEQLFQKLNMGRTQVIVSGKKRGMKYVNDDSLEVVILEDNVATIHIYHYLNKKNAHLVPMITDTLKQMKSDGRIAEIFSNVRRLKQ
ncbi:hypothetical protein GCM10007916_11860 [Psychromonas marina]|uniref:Transporter substrate-binding domain-containing protein n=1 Tax=Psychromonas marina TaxID=88364 RepID=A0ABQ6DY86_9GAMM|nr:transporter substrate-binding domain-containing protein [Psychromonas marina]GLS90119.1 hypothetical protein GCM10007916_11860 [Psychromonas marina]